MVQMQAKNNLQQVPVVICICKAQQQQKQKPLQGAFLVPCKGITTGNKQKPLQGAF